MSSAGRIAWGVGAAVVAALAYRLWDRTDPAAPDVGTASTAPAPAAPPPPLAGLGRPRATSAPTKGASGSEGEAAAPEAAAEAVVRMVPVTLRLVRSDGLPVERATVRSGDDETRVYPWDPRTSTASLPAGKQSIEVLGGRFGEWRQPEDFAIEVRPDMPPVEVTLRPWRMIVGHLRVADGGPAVRAAARLRAVLTNGERGDDPFREITVESGPASDGWFCFGQDFELDPGEYEVTASPWSYGPTRATQSVIVRNEAVVVELELPRSDPAEGVTLRVLGPDGRPHEPSIVTLDVRDVKGGGGGGKATTEPLGDGLYWIPTLLPGYSGNDPVEVTLWVRSAAYGERRIDLPVKRGVAPIVVRFETPAELRVTVANRTAWLRDGAEVEAWLPVAGGTRRLGHAPLAADGTATLVGLQPGEVQLGVAGQGPVRGLCLGFGPFVLRPGENHPSISAPSLHPLRVNGIWGSLLIQAADGSGTRGLLGMGDGGSALDIPGLPAGTYTLKSANRSATVEIPAVSEVTLTEPASK